MTSGAIAVSSLNGSEQVVVDNGGAVVVTATTQQIANLAALGDTTQITNTAITTVGNGTLTAAALVGGLVTRTGPTSAYSDATDSAANIVAALPEFVSGATFFIRIKNGTIYVQTITAGASVTLPTTVIIGPHQEGSYYGVVGGTSGSPTVTLVHIATVPIATATSLTAPSALALNTVGAGTVTAAGINGGATLRGGSQSATPFADTTDTANAIIAGNPGLVGKIGAAFVYYYVNTTNALCTLGGGVGVTVSQASLGTTALIPAGMSGGFLVTYTAASTITMVCIGLTNNVATTYAFAGSSSGETLVTASSAASGTLTLPAATDVLIGKATTDILTNKSIGGSGLGFNGSSSGTTTVVATAAAGTTTQTLPPVTGTLASTTGSDLYVVDVYRGTSLNIQNSVTPTLIPGLAGAVVIGTYRFRAAIYTTPAATGGVAISFVLTTAVLSACNFVATTLVAAASATTATTTTSSATSIVAVATIPLLCLIEGTFTVSTGGTFSLYGCQNTQVNSAATINTGSYMELTRIA